MGAVENDALGTEEARFELCSNDPIGLRWDCVMNGHPMYGLNLFWVWAHPPERQFRRSVPSTSSGQALRTTL